MQQSVKSANGIISGVIWKQLLAFFFPILLGTLFQQLYNTVDAMVVGQFVSKEALAAVGGSASQILNLIIGFFTGVSSGATVIVSQFFGAKDDDDVSRAVHTALIFAAAGGALMTLIGLVCAPTLLEWMNTPPETMAQSVLYLRVVFLAMVPGMIYNVGSAILRAVGDSKRPLYFLMLCCVVNVALDLLFVLGFGMGVAGVAVATALSQLVSAVMIVVSLARSKQSYRLERRRLRLDRQLLGRTVRIGLPTGLQAVMYALSNMIITSCINGFGTDTVAAWITLGKVDGMNWMILNALGISVMTFVGQNYGAHDLQRVRKSIRVCLLMAFGMVLSFSVVLFITGRQLFGIFTRDEAVIRITMQMMCYLAPSYWLYVPIEIFSGSLRGMGDTLVPTMITAVGICGLRVLWMLLVVPGWHTLFAVVVNYPLSWGLTSLAFIFYYRRFRKRRLLRA